MLQTARLCFRVREHIDNITCVCCVKSAQLHKHSRCLRFFLYCERSANGMHLKNLTDLPDTVG